jgi:hypothetical protein
MRYVALVNGHSGNVGINADFELFAQDMGIPNLKFACQGFEVSCHLQRVVGN